MQNLKTIYISVSPCTKWRPEGPPDLSTNSIPDSNTTYVINQYYRPLQNKGFSRVSQGPPITHGSNLVLYYQNERCTTEVSYQKNEYDFVRLRESYIQIFPVLRRLLQIVRVSCLDEVRYGRIKTVSCHLSSLTHG